jgi:hypothetical protein
MRLPAAVVKQISKNPAVCNVVLHDKSSYPPLAASPGTMIPEFGMDLKTELLLLQAIIRSRATDMDSDIQKAKPGISSRFGSVSG